MYRDERGKPFTKAQMPNQWSQDVASMDPEKVDEEDQHSFTGWLADMLSWGPLHRDRRGRRVSAQ
jgi:hypothetical protein